ncbi:helix-turn-helix transcriptional regulator [Rhodospirillaceae bacterium KN72]|uniref:Helix-turn-helix transcriptional regulator n=1 Tax=Pacificispira spongiicola TaxID=2729598 RepID=A0A7Y0E1U4_9PROT|nr:helix-turn-helix domain-containing protein [Pacificispira spongiicola]NMM45692.1 helix-turn-helix transcriptional regulator [Pacificispira spongiicola]
MKQPTFTCGLDAALRLIAGKWKPLILFFLRNGPMRYGALKRSVRGVSDKMLIQQLKELEAQGVVSRTDYKEIPPRVDYALTPLGTSLVETFVPLCEWGERHADAIATVLVKQDAVSDG